MQDSHAPKLEAALAYAARGWHVFPLRPNGKVPAGALVRHGQDDATTDEQVIRGWWAAEPDANIGIHCAPSGIYVVDVDVKGGMPGAATWTALVAEHGAVPSLTARTPSGGMHVYFSGGEGLRNTQGSADPSKATLGPGIDTRGNGYVVAPGSTINGGAYSWVKPDAAVAPLPAWIGDRVRGPVSGARVPAERPVRASGDLFVTPSSVAEAPPAGIGETVARVVALRDELAGAPEGQGNGEAARLAYLAGQYVGAGQIAHEDAVTIMKSALNGWTYASHGDERAMISTIERQIDAGARNPRAWGRSFARPETAEVQPVAEEPDQPAAEEPDPAEAYESAVAAMMGRLIPAAEMEDWPEPEPLIEGFLSKGMIARLSGASNTGKSFVALDMAAAVGSGQDWHGRKTVRGPVVYLVAEGVSGMRKRIRAWQDHHGRQMDGVFLYPQAVQVMDEEWGTFAEVCRRVGASLVVLDTQSRVTVGVEENSNTEMARVMARIDGLRDLTGATVLMVHHTGHQEQRSRGASSVYGALDHEFLVSRLGDGTVQFKTTKQKDMEFAEDILFRLEKVGPEPVQGAQDPRSLVVVKCSEVDASGPTGEVFTAAQGRLMDVLEATSKEGSTKIEAEKLFKDPDFGRGGPRSRGTFYTTWKELDDKGFLRAESVRGVTRYYLVSEEHRRVLGRAALVRLGHQGEGR